MLDKLVPIQLPYPIRGAIIRSVRTAIAILLAGLAASIADGSIIAQIAFIPEEYKPVVLFGLSTAFVGIDKFLRERDLVANPDEELPTSDNTGPGNLPDGV